MLECDWQLLLLNFTELKIYFELLLDHFRSLYLYHHIWILFMQWLHLMLLFSVIIFINIFRLLVLLIMSLLQRINFIYFPNELMANKYLYYNFLLLIHAVVQEQKHMSSSLLIHLQIIQTDFDKHSIIHHPKLTLQLFFQIQSEHEWASSNFVIQS